MTSLEKQFFKEGELKSLLSDLSKEASKTEGLDPYQCFINGCKNKTYAEGIKTEKHHIKPIHAGGTNDPSNLITLSIKDHITAHWLLWQVFDSQKDKKAYLFRVSNSEERTLLQRENINKNVDNYRKNSLFFFNSNFQSEQGKKGGLIGGAKNTEKQFLARQKVGKEWGPVIGIRNQSPKLVEFLAKFSIWSYRGYQSIKGDFFPESQIKSKADFELADFRVLIEPKESFKSLAESLEKFAPGSINLEKVSSMHKLIDKEKRIYGWKLIDTLTRSEVEAGALLEKNDVFLTEDLIPE
jgi:hypothetical protein